MSAAPERGGVATPSLSIRLRTDVFDALAANLAGTEQDRARLIGLDRTTLYRIRRGRVVPTLDVAMRLAERLGTTVDELFEVAA
jgi:DNA-binding XRE family transcriptional regulator